MTRKDCITALEELRTRVVQIGQAFGSIDQTDATNLEGDRRGKTAKLIIALLDRLYEDIAISTKIAIDNAKRGIGEQGGLFGGERAATDILPLQEGDEA